MRLVLFTLLFFGAALIMVGFIRSQSQCLPPKIDYRFIPRTFIEEQESPVSVTDMFAKMFFEDNRFINTESSKLLPPPGQRRDMNKFFISQN